MTNFPVLTTCGLFSALALISKAPISTKEENKPKIVMASENFINYQGSAELIKVDENGKSLSGAVFNVTNSETHEVVIKGIKTDANGVIKANHLKPGKYTFVETEAPAGYQLSQETRAFEIKASAENKPQVVILFFC